MDEWERIKSRIKSIADRVKEDVKEERLTAKEAGLISGFSADLEKVLNDFEELEKEITLSTGSSDLLDPSNSEIRKKFKELLNRFLSLPVSMPGLWEGMGNRKLNEVWGYGLEAVTAFLERRARVVGVKSWSVGATVGFPTGVSGTITVNFE